MISNIYRKITTDMNDINQQIPGWFKPLTIFALIWNIIGVAAFAVTFMITPEVIANLPLAEQEIFNNTPVWATAAFGIAVFAGVAGCILLLMKKALAFEIFIISIVGVILQNFHAFILANSLEVYGPGALGMPTFVFLVGVGLILLSKKAKAQGWIN